MTTITRDEIATLFGTIIGHISASKLAAVIDAEKDLTHASMQLGTSAQAAANSKRIDAIHAAVASMPNYSLELVADIAKAVK